MGISSSGVATAQDDSKKIRMPDLPPAGGMAVDYGYTPAAMVMPLSMGMPNLNIQPQEFGIVDPTYLAQLAILNQPASAMQFSYGDGIPLQAPVGLLGSGLEFQNQYAQTATSAPMIADWRASMPVAPSSSFNTPLSAIFGGGDNDGGGGGDGMGSVGTNSDGTTGPGDSTGHSSGGGRGVDGMDGDGSNGGGDGGGDKIVCTAMNHAYGFGSFRNRIWLAYSAKNLTKAHEVGYHTMFLPLVNAGYKQDNWFSKPLRAVLENIARHRSADLRAEMRGGKRDRVGQAYRFILEPLCYAVGKLKGY